MDEVKEVLVLYERWAHAKTSDDREYYHTTLEERLAESTRLEQSCLRSIAEGNPPNIFAIYNLGHVLLRFLEPAYGLAPNIDPQMIRHILNRGGFVRFALTIHRRRRGVVSLKQLCLWCLSTTATMWFYAQFIRVGRGGV